MSDEAIRARENLRYEALVDGDWDAFEGLCHPELAYVHSNAVIDSRASYVEKFREGQYVYRRISHPIDRVVVVGDVAMVFGQMIADVSAAGVAKRLDNQSLAIWRRTDGGWLLYAYQPTVRG